MHVELELTPAAAEDQVVLENLLQLYIHDFSEVLPIDIGNNGRYSYTNLPAYWSDASRLPLLARIDGRLAGFALIAKMPFPSGDGEAFDIAEFFVLRRYRHCGIGREMAEKLWFRFPGKWQIRVMENNVEALKFWATSIAKFTGEVAKSTCVESDGTTWHVFSFDSRRRIFPHEHSILTP